MSRYLIPLDKIEEAIKRLEQIKNRANKKGIGDFAYQVAEETTIVAHPKNEIIKVLVKAITIETPKPLVNGWEFVGKLDHTVAQDEVVWCGVPGQTIPDHIWLYRGSCDHCGQHRVRNFTYVLYNEDLMDYKVVGKSCLSDFCSSYGPNDPAKALAALDYIFLLSKELEEFQEPLGLGSCRSLTLDLVVYLAWVLEVMKKYGWVSRKEERECEFIVSTATHACNAMFAESSKYGIANTKELLEKHSECIADMIAWLEVQPANSDYIKNLQVIVGSGQVAFHHTGIVASLPMAYDKYLASTKGVLNEHFGTVGKRETFIVTVDNKRYIDTGFGYGGKDRYLMRDPAGRKAIWWSTADVNLEVGNTYEVKATVKKHDVWNDQKQTVLSRVKVIG